MRTLKNICISSRWYAHILVYFVKSYSLVKFHTTHRLDQPRPIRVNPTLYICAKLSFTVYETVARVEST